MKISWGKVTGASGYYVYRRTSSTGSWTRLKSTTGTSYTDTTAKTGTTYYYTVKAYSGSYASSYITNKTIKYLAQPSVTLSNTSSGVKVSWGKVTGASGYYVYRKTTSGSWTKIKIDDVHQLYGYQCEKWYHILLHRAGLLWLYPE